MERILRRGPQIVQELRGLEVDFVLALFYSRVLRHYPRIADASRFPSEDISYSMANERMIEVAKCNGVSGLSSNTSSDLV